MLHIVHLLYALSAQGAGTAAASSLSTGFYAAGYMNTQYQTSFTNTQQETSVGSNFVAGNNISIASNKDFETMGSILGSGSGDITIAANEVNIKAGESTFTQESGYKTTNAGVSVGNNSVQVSAGYSQGSSDILQVTNTNSKILAKNGTFNSLSKEDTNIIGGNVIAEDVNMLVGGNLKVETVQDTYEEVGSGFGIQVSKSFGVPDALKPVDNTVNKGADILNKVATPILKPATNVLDSILTTAQKVPGFKPPKNAPEQKGNMFTGDGNPNDVGKSPGMSFPAGSITYNEVDIFNNIQQKNLV